MIKNAQPSAVILLIVYKILWSILILSTTGCYTILSPLSEYTPPEQNQSINGVDDSNIVAKKYINHYNYYNCTGYENSCRNRYWRYNSWTDTYYYDPYYYNSTYHHHHNDNYWWYSNSQHHNDNYSNNNSFIPPKKTKRNRSYSRHSSDSVNSNANQENTSTNNSYTENSSDSVNASTSQENTQSSTSNDKPKSNNKRRRKHNRKPL